MDAKDSNGNLLTDRAGKTVGFLHDNNYFASLEYSFTGKMAFKGWKGYGGPDFNSFTKSGTYTNGFWVFDDGNESKGNWDYIEGTHTELWNRYYDDVDFCSSHRNDIANDCSLCYNTPNRSWPGIRMIEEKGENEGWWKFELTGVATPGKALIMFADVHSGDAGDKRFPAANVVGMPLFDYPDREGWFWFNDYVTDRSSNNFSDNKPTGSSQPAPLDKTIKWYIFRWDKNNNWGDDKHAVDRVYITTNTGAARYDKDSDATYAVESGDYRYMVVDITKFSGDVLSFTAERYNKNNTSIDIRKRLRPSELVNSLNLPTHDQNEDIRNYNSASDKRAYMVDISY